MSDQPHRFALLGQEPIATIDRLALKDKLDRKEPIKLVMVLNRWGFDAKHIPSSLHFDSPDELYSAVNKDYEVAGTTSLSQRSKEPSQSTVKTISELNDMVRGSPEPPALRVLP